MDYEGDSELVALGDIPSGMNYETARELLESAGIEYFFSKLGAIDRLMRPGRDCSLYVRQEDFADARAILDVPFKPIADTCDTDSEP